MAAQTELKGLNQNLFMTTELTFYLLWKRVTKLKVTKRIK